MDRKSQIEFLIKFLGVEYGEEFALQYEYEEYPGLQATYYIDKEEGLKYKEPCNYIYALAEGELLEAVWDGATIVHKPFPVPPKEKTYWRYSITSGYAREVLCKYVDTGVLEDYAIGNCFETEEEANRKGPQLLLDIKERYEKEYGNN